MSTYVKLTVYRRLDNRLEGQDDNSPRAVELHALRSQALHDVFDKDLTWQVADWGDADDEQPHESVELWIKLHEMAVALAPVTAPAFLYVGKILLDKGIETGVVEGVKRLLSKFWNKQEEGRIRNVSVTFNNEITINCHPEAGLTITLRTHVTIPYSAAPDQIKWLENNTDTISVPAALAPLVRQLIAKPPAV